MDWSTVCPRLRILAVLFLSVFLVHFSPTLSAAGPSQDGQTERRIDPKSRYAEGEVLVKFKRDVSEADRRAAHAQIGAEVVSVIRALSIQHVRGARGQSTEALLKAYRLRPDVAYAEPNVVVKALNTPNDPRFPEQWPLHNTGQTGGTEDADIDAPEAWERDTDASAIVVASIDTGVDYRHPDLAANMWTNPGEIAGNGIDDDGNGYVDDVYGWDFAGRDNDPMDDNGHGTHTAGIMGAVANNGVGIAGVAWSARIMAVKFLDQWGYGYLSDAVSAVVYATDMGARVSNNSWGADQVSQALEDAIAYANSKNMIFVAAAGNDTGDLGYDWLVVHPCESPQPNVICVGATENNDEYAGFSNFGSPVDLAAPGRDVLSTLPTGVCELCDASGYGLLTGTSMATPHVAAAAALALSHDGALTPAIMKMLLMDSTDPHGTQWGFKAASGGRLNLDRALSMHFTLRPYINWPDGYLLLTVGAPKSATATINAHSLLDGFTGPVTLSATTSHPSVTASFDTPVITLPSYGSAQATLTVTISEETTIGDYQITVTGTSATGEMRTRVIKLSVGGQDFAMSVRPTAKQALSTGSAAYQVELETLFQPAFSSPVTLSLLTNEPTLSWVFERNTINSIWFAKKETSWLTVNTAGTARGSYELTVVATAGDLVRRAKITLNVTDNDLTATSVSTPTTVITPGSAISVLDSVSNQSANSSSGSFVVRFYLSKDQVINSSDTVLGQRLVNDLGPGASSSGETAVTVPSYGLSSGDYYLAAVADGFNEVPETDEKNNVTLTSAFVVGKPLISALSASERTQTTATLAANVNPAGAETTVWLEWGTSYSYGNVSPAQAIGSATTSVAVSQAVTGLAPFTTYYYRVAAANSYGTVYGAPSSFRTLAHPPGVVTGAASNITTSTALLSGSVTANGVPGTAWFEYGVDTTYGQVTTTADVWGTSATAVSKSALNLSPRTTYHYRFVAKNEGGVSYGEDATFTTPPLAPKVTTAPASEITRSAATLSGTVNPEGAVGNVWFEYGTTTSYGSKTAPQPVDGTDSLPISLRIEGLAESTYGTTYNYRTVASTGGGTTYGPNQTFTTLPEAPYVGTGAATNIAQTTVTLGGVVDTRAVAGTVWVEYGTDMTYGSTSASLDTWSRWNVSVSFNLTGLKANTTYHYRVVAKNISGVSYGLDQTFTTLPDPPAVTTLAASGIKTTSATANAIVDANGAGSVSVWFQLSGDGVTWGDQIPKGYTGTGDITVSEVILGLTSGTRYYYRAVATNKGGTTYGTPVSFTTKGK